MRRTSIALAPVACALLMALACEGPPLTPTVGDRAPEVTLSRDRLLASFTRDGDWLVSPPLEAPELATRVAVMLDVVNEHPTGVLPLQARAIDLSGEAAPWQPLEVTWAEHPASVARVDFQRTASAAQLRLRAEDAQSLSWILWSTFVPADEARSVASSSLLGPGEAPLDGVVGVAGPATAQRGLLAGVNSRASWGARAATCSSADSSKNRVSIHHTVTYPDLNGDYAARIREIQAFHMDGRGYCDIGYHVMVSLDGQRWQARPENVLGAHAGGQNTGNLGVSLIGCFHPTSDCAGIGPNQPPQAMINGTVAMVATAATHYGINISSATVMGHRDNPGQATACPGDNVHAQLNAIRAAAANGGTPAATTGRALGTVWDLAVTTDAAQSGALGARIVGATVSVAGQSQTLTADDTLWSFDLPPGTHTITATAAGYATTTRDVTVTAGTDAWASIGLTPQATSSDLTVAVYDAALGVSATIADALVAVTGADAQRTNADGEIAFTLPAGGATVVITSEGFEPLTRDLQLVAGQAQRLELGLTAVAVTPPDAEPPANTGDGNGEENPPVEPPSPDKDRPFQATGDDIAGTPVDIRGDLTTTSAGCSATHTPSSGAPAALAVLALLALAFRRRRTR